MSWFVYIVESESLKIAKRMGPMSERKADRVCDGVRINLDFDRFHVETSRRKLAEAETMTEDPS